MRTLRPFAVATLAAVMTLAATSVVLAQADEEEPARSGLFSATIADFVEVDDMVWVPGQPHGRLDEWKMVVDVQATNPRLSGTWTLVQDCHGFGEPGTPEAFSVYAGKARLENDDGAWVGDVMNFASDPYEHMRLVVEGEGGNDGLTAIIEQASEFGEFYGVVFEYGMPAQPAE